MSADQVLSVEEILKKINWLLVFNVHFKSLGWCVLRHGENTVYCRLLDKVPNNWALSHLNLTTVWSVCILHYGREIVTHRTINYFYFHRDFVIKFTQPFLLNWRKQLGTQTCILLPHLHCQQTKIKLNWSRFCEWLQIIHRFNQATSQHSCAVYKYFFPPFAMLFMSMCVNCQTDATMRLVHCNDGKLRFIFQI